MKRRTFLLGALLTACTATPSANIIDGGGTDGGSIDRSKPKNKKPKTEPGDVASVVASTNRFAMAMFEQLRAEPGNVASSPASIALALNMTRAGARGSTAAQMKSTLAIALDDDRAHDAFGSLLHGWNHGPEKRAYELAVVNRLFGEKTMAFEKPFLTVTGDSYGAELEPVSFKTAPESARETINDWVAEQTDQRIEGLLPAGSIKANTRLVLTNAIYFKGKWKVAFDEKNTRPASFFAPSGEEQVPMMNVTDTFDYAEADGIKLVELPYQGDDLAMTLIVPDDHDGIAELEEALSDESLARWLGKAQKEEVSLALPRFTIDPPQSVKLKPMLIAMGMPDAFDKTKADLSGIAITNEGRLVVDDAYHKAFVEVNEEGTEAAAATGVVISVESAAVSKEKRVVADRPFLFLIRDKTSGAILFIGRVENPNAKAP